MVRFSSERSETVQLPDCWNFPSFLTDGENEMETRRSKGFLLRNLLTVEPRILRERRPRHGIFPTSALGIVKEALFFFIAGFAKERKKKRDAGNCCGSCPVQCSWRVVVVQ